MKPNRYRTIIKMMERSILVIWLAVAFVFATKSAADALPCDLGQPIRTIADQLGATCNNGLAPLGAFGTVTGGFNDTGYQTTPLDGLTDYSYTQPSPLGAAAGNTADFHWVHETSVSTSSLTAPSGGTTWSFGTSSTQFMLYPSIDHAPTPQEALEGTLWGSNDSGATWVKGTVIELFALGFHPFSIDDQPASLWSFSYSVNMISATWGITQGTYSYSDGDVEIDAVAAIVPEPSSLLLLGSGLAALGLWGRRRLKERS